MSSSYRLELDKWLSQLEVKADRVLDVGGSQLPVKGRTKSWDVNEYLIADLPNPHKDSPKPDIELDLNTFDSGISVGDKDYESYDLIFCLEIFDYVWNTYFAFEELQLRLKQGGWLWATFPSFYPLHQPIEDDALRYMPSGIEKLAASVGLEVVQMIKRRPETKLLEQWYQAERMRAAKHEDHNFTGFICGFRKI